MIEILKAIDKHGSLRLAAENLGINYKRLWIRLRNAEIALGYKLVEKGRVDQPVLLL